MMLYLIILTALTLLSYSSAANWQISVLWHSQTSWPLATCFTIHLCFMMHMLTNTDLSQCTISRPILNKACNLHSQTQKSTSDKHTSDHWTQNNAYHLPPQLSQRMAIKRSTEPRMARWMMTGRFFSLLSSPLPQHNIQHPHFSHQQTVCK